MNEDEELDPEELAQAEALAEALDRGHAGDALDDEALRTAALLRYSQNGGELRADRHDAILEEVLSNAARVKRAQPAAPWWRRWLPGMAVAFAVAVAILIAIRIRGSGPAELPSPSVALLRAQLERAGGGEPIAYQSAMRGYRGELYSALERRYGE